jgi:hypothetical protein
VLLCRCYCSLLDSTVQCQGQEARTQSLAFPAHDYNAAVTEPPRDARAPTEHALLSRVVLFLSPLMQQLNINLEDKQKDLPHDRKHLSSLGEKERYGFVTND